MLAVSLKIISLTLTLNSKLNKEKIMFKYNVQIQKVSGSLNESVLPSKSLVVKSKTKKTDEQVFAEASKFYKEKYGLVIESAEIDDERFSRNTFINRFNQEIKTINDFSKFIINGEYDDGRNIRALINSLQHAILWLKNIPYGEDGRTVGDNYEKFLR